MPVTPLSEKVGDTPLPPQPLLHLTPLTSPAAAHPSGPLGPLHHEYGSAGP